MLLLFPLVLRPRVVFVGERAWMKDSNLLGEFKLSSIPPAPRGVPQIEARHVGVIADGRSGGGDGGVQTDCGCLRDCAHRLFTLSRGFCCVSYTPVSTRVCDNQAAFLATRCLSSGVLLYTESQRHGLHFDRAHCALKRRR